VGGFRVERKRFESHLSKIPKDHVSVGVKDGESEKKKEVRGEVVGEEVLSERRVRTRVRASRAREEEKGETETRLERTSQSPMISSNPNSRLKAIRIHLKDAKEVEEKSVQRDRDEEDEPERGDEPEAEEQIERLGLL